MLLVLVGTAATTVSNVGRSAQTLAHPHDTTGRRAGPLALVFLGVIRAEIDLLVVHKDKVPIRAILLVVAIPRINLVKVVLDHDTIGLLVDLVGLVRILGFRRETTEMGSEARIAAQPRLLPLVLLPVLKVIERNFLGRCALFHGARSRTAQKQQERRGGQKGPKHDGIGSE